MCRAPHWPDCWSLGFTAINAGTAQRSTPSHKRSNLGESPILSPTIDLGEGGRGDHGMSLPVLTYWAVVAWFTRTSRGKRLCRCIGKRTYPGFPPHRLIAALDQRQE